MEKTIYRYAFKKPVDMDEVEASLVLAILSAESLHGAVQAKLDIAHAFDAKLRKCVIDATTQVGRDFNKLFLGFLTREFGPCSFSVEKMKPEDHTPPTPAL